MFLAFSIVRLRIYFLWRDSEYDLVGRLGFGTWFVSRFIFTERAKCISIHFRVPNNIEEVVIHCHCTSGKI